MGHELGVVKMILGAGLIVKLVLLTLLAFSITSWIIIVLKFLLIRRSQKQSNDFIDVFWQSRNLGDAYSKARQLKESTVANVFRTAYKELKRVSTASDSTMPDSLDSRSRLDTVRRVLRRAATEETNRMAQMIPFLATAGSTAPFIGLFGTVWGIMNSFQGIAQKGSANLAVVAPGIAEALIATAVGLAVAIPSVIAYNFFSQKINVIDAELNSFVADFLNIVERDILKPKGEDR